MRLRHYKIVLTFAIFCRAGSAFADFDSQFLTGYGYGLLQLATPITTTSIPLTMLISYEAQYYKTWKGTVGAVFQHSLISYNDENNAYSGQNVSAGLNVSAHIFQRQKSFFRIGADYYPHNQLAVTTDSSNSVNGQSYKHSSLITFSGSTAYTYRFSYLQELTGGQFNNRERLRAGIHLSQMQQQFTKRTLLIRTSRPSLSPDTDFESDVDMMATTTALNVSLGFAF